MSEVDAKIAAAEARTDTKFAQLDTKFAEIRTDFADLRGEIRVIANQTAGLKTTVIVTGIAVLGLTLAALGWGATIFGDGMSASTIADQAAAKAGQQIQSELATYREEQRRQGEQIDMLVKAIAPRTENGQPDYKAVPAPMPKNGATGSPMVPMMGDK